MTLDQSQFRDLLKDKGLKLTTQRRAVLEVLLNRHGEHLTTEEIYDYVKQFCPEIGLATVYRTVQLMEDMKIIRKLNFDDGCSRYEIASNTSDHYHHHLICENCGKVIEVEEDLLDNLEDKIQNKFGFMIKDHILKFFGICKECKSKSDENS